MVYHVKFECDGYLPFTLRILEQVLIRLVLENHGIL